jgi:hypothetical protein
MAALVNLNRLGASNVAARDLKLSKAKDPSVA